MKKAALAILFAFITTANFAQTSSTRQAPAKATQAQPTIAQRADAITASMVSNLNLNAEQAKELQTVNLASLQSAETAKKKYKGTPRQAVAQIDIISQTRLSQIKDILTPLQFQQYQQRREEKMGVPQEAQSNPEARHNSPLHQESY